MMAEENKSSGFVNVFVGGIVFALVAVVVATMVFNDWGYMRRDHRVVAPAPVSAVVGTDLGSRPSPQQEYVLAGQVQVNESRPCTPGTSILVNGQMRECASSVPQTTGACWRDRNTGLCAPNRTYEQGPPDQMSVGGSAQAPSTPSENLVGPP